MNQTTPLTGALTEICSDPTATSLIGCFCELAKHPEQMEKLHEELGNLDPRDVRALGSLQHLNAVLDEAMRLYPALMTGGQRKTSKNGAWIGDTFIPPETTIVAPRYSISRREYFVWRGLLCDHSDTNENAGEDCFERATEFVPERFTTDQHMVKVPAAFTPWGTGKHTGYGIEPERQGR